MKRLVLLLFAFAFLSANEFVGTDFEVLKNADIKDYYVSEYIDGMSAYWDGKNLFNNRLQKYEIDPNFTKNFPPFELKGLLFCGTDYYDTVNDVMLDKLRCTKFYVADVPHEKDDLMDRLQYLKDYLDKHPNDKIVFVKQHNFNTPNEFIDFFNTVTLTDSEGVYLHKKHTDYDVAKSDKILRIRKFYKDNCIISKVNKDENNKLINYECKWKKTNALRVSKDKLNYIDNDEYSKIIIGSGFNMNDIENPLEVGTKIAFKYYKLSKDNKPMHCVFIRAF